LEAEVIALGIIFGGLAITSIYGYIATKKKLEKHGKSNPGLWPAGS